MNKFLFFCVMSPIVLAGSPDDTDTKVVQSQNGSPDGIGNLRKRLLCLEDDMNFEEAKRCKPLSSQVIAFTVISGGQNISKLRKKDNPSATILSVQIVSTEAEKATSPIVKKFRLFRRVMQRKLMPPPPVYPSCNIKSGDDKS